MFIRTEKNGISPHSLGAFLPFKLYCVLEVLSRTFFFAPIIAKTSSFFYFTIFSSFFNSFFFLLPPIHHHHLHHHHHPLLVNSTKSLCSFLSPCIVFFFFFSFPSTMATIISLSLFFRLIIFFILSSFIPFQYPHPFHSFFKIFPFLYTKSFALILMVISLSTLHYVLLPTISFFPPPPFTTCFLAVLYGIAIQYS